MSYRCQNSVSVPFNVRPNKRNPRQNEEQVGRTYWIRSTQGHREFPNSRIVIFELISQRIYVYVFGLIFTYYKFGLQKLTKQMYIYCIILEL